MNLYSPRILPIMNKRTWYIKQTATIVIMSSYQWSSLQVLLSKKKSVTGLLTCVTDEPVIAKMINIRIILMSVLTFHLTLSFSQIDFIFYYCKVTFIITKTIQQSIQFSKGPLHFYLNHNNLFYCQTYRLKGSCAHETFLTQIIPFVD